MKVKKIQYHKEQGKDFVYFCEFTDSSVSPTFLTQEEINPKKVFNDYIESLQNKTNIASKMNQWMQQDRMSPTKVVNKQGIPTQVIQGAGIQIQQDRSGSQVINITDDKNMMSKVNRVGGNEEDTMQQDPQIKKKPLKKRLETIIGLVKNGKELVFSVKLELEKPKEMTASELKAKYPNEFINYLLSKIDIKTKSSSSSDQSDSSDSDSDSSDSSSGDDEDEKEDGKDSAKDE